MPRGKKAPKSAPVVDLAVVTAEIEPMRSMAERYLQAIVNMPITSQADVDVLGKELIENRERRDALEAKRKTLTGPVNDLKRAIDALFKPVKDIFDAVDTTITNKLGPYQQQAKAANTAALDAVGGGSRDASTLATAHAVPQTPAGLSEIEEYDFEIENEAEIPRPFLCFDESLARAYVKHHKGNCTIPGVKIVKRTTYRRTGAAV